MQTSGQILAYTEVSQTNWVTRALRPTPHGVVDAVFGHHRQVHDVYARTAQPGGYPTTGHGRGRLVAGLGRDGERHFPLVAGAACATYAGPGLPVPISAVVRRYGVPDRACDEGLKCRPAAERHSGQRDGERRDAGALCGGVTDD